MKLQNSIIFLVFFFSVWTVDLLAPTGPIGLDDHEMVAHCLMRSRHVDTLNAALNRIKETTFDDPSYPLEIQRIQKRLYNGGLLRGHKNYRYYLRDRLSKHFYQMNDHCAWVSSGMSSHS